MKTTQNKNFQLSLIGSSNREITMDFTPSCDENVKSPIIVFCHGYKGFKDWGCWGLVANMFSDNGFHFLKFNFSHNGVTADNLTEFVDLEAFGNNNYTKELFDVEKVMDWVTSKNEFANVIDVNNIYLIGHSRGGGIATLATANDSRIAKTVTWASVSNLIDRLPKNHEEWKDKGVVYQMNGRTKQNMPLFYQFYENTMANSEELDIAKKARSIKTPFCVIHGRKDMVVKEEDAEALDSFISTSRLLVIEGAGHTFGSSHPYTEKELPVQLSQVVEESISFLREV